MGDNISAVEGIQYCGRIPSVLWGDNSSTCGGYLQYSGGNISTVGGYFSTVEGIQYIGGIISVYVGDNISTVGRQDQYCKGYSVQWGKNFNFGMFGH